MTPSPEKINRELRKLRRFIETDADTIATRVAYSYEQAIRWATEDTVGWPGPLQQAKDDARILRDDLAAKETP